MKTLYACESAKGDIAIRLCYDGKKYSIRSKNKDKWEESWHGKITCPLTASNAFVQEIEQVIRNRIGDMFEREGKNRYTGR